MSGVRGEHCGVLDGSGEAHHQPPVGDPGYRSLGRIAVFGEEAVEGRVLRGS